MFQAESYDLVLSAAGDGVHLWDLRTSRVVRKFNEHTNRSNRMGLDFSPCGRYIAVSSEDRAAYLYDIRLTER